MEHHTLPSPPSPRSREGVAEEGSDTDGFTDIMASAVLKSAGEEFLLPSFSGVLLLHQPLPFKSNKQNSFCLVKQPPTLYFSIPSPLGVGWVGVASFREKPPPSEQGVGE